MKILHVCHSDGFGGASIGAKRLHQTMIDHGLHSRLLVANKFSDSPMVLQLPDDPNRQIKNYINEKILSFHKTSNPVIRSLNIFGRGAAKYINNSSADVVQFHWINADTVSISEIAKIKKPIVWKMPDMWAFSGAEHYLLPDDPHRYVQGYNNQNRPEHECGLDLNKFVWMYKRYCWRNSSFRIVSPSKWLAECARNSKLFKDRFVYNIPNPIDLKQYIPLAKSECRQHFDLPEDKNLILFAALASMIDKRKGFHFLSEALEILSSKGLNKNTDLVILGNQGKVIESLHGFKVHNLGRVKDQSVMIKAYNASDFHVFPTQADNLPNVVKEAIACGLPCVGFNIGGMPDMIKHKDFGYLAKPFDASDLANGLEWVLDQNNDELSKRARKHAEMLHNPEKCINSYLRIYEDLIASQT